MDISATELINWLDIGMYVPQLQDKIYDKLITFVH